MITNLRIPYIIISCLLIIVGLLCLVTADHQLGNNSLPFMKADNAGQDDQKSESVTKQEEEETNDHRMMSTKDDEPVFKKLAVHVFTNGTDLRHPIHLNAAIDRLDPGFMFRLFTVISVFGLLMLFFVMIKTFAFRNNKNSYGHVPNAVYDSEILNMFNNEDFRDDDEDDDDEDDLTVFDAGQYKRLSSTSGQAPLLKA